MEISSKTLFVFLSILCLAAAAGANTTQPANCTPHPAIFNNGGPTPVTCPPFNVPGGTITLVTLSFAADYQFGGTTGTNVVRFTFAPAGPAETTWSPASVTLTTSGGRSSGPSPTGTMNATGVSTEAFTAPFTVNVTSEVAAGTVASSSGAASVVYTYTPPPPVTATCPADTGTVGARYNSVLVASGGVPPYTFSIVAGNLPPGSSLGPTGNLRGTPTAEGTYSFTVQVVDSTGSAAGTTTANCAIKNAAPEIRFIKPSPSPPTGACANAPAAATVTYATYTYATPGVTVVFAPAFPYGRTIVVNQNPEVVIREYRRNSPSPKQPPYFIALTDTSIYLADAYWVKDSTLYYVTSDHELAQTPLSSIDRPLSERLNCEKNLPFYLPGEVQSTSDGPSRTGWPVASKTSR